MVAKFQGDHRVIEVDKRDAGVSFFIYEPGEEQIGQEIVISIKETHELIKYLQEVSNYPRLPVISKN